MYVFFWLPVNINIEIQNKQLWKKKDEIFGEKVNEEYHGKNASYK